MSDEPKPARKRKRYEKIEEIDSDIDTSKKQITHYRTEAEILDAFADLMRDKFAHFVSYDHLSPKGMAVLGIREYRDLADRKRAKSFRLENKIKALSQARAVFLTGILPEIVPDESIRKL